MFEYLIQSGASPLMIASQYGMLEVVQALLRFHARVDVFDEVTEAHLASKIIQNLSATYNLLIFHYTHSENCSSLAIIFQGSSKILRILA